MRDSSLFHPPARTMLLSGLLVIIIVFAVFALKKPPAPQPSTSPYAPIASPAGELGEKDSTSSVYAETPAAESQGIARASVQAPIRTGCVLNFAVKPDVAQISPGSPITYAITIADTGTEPCVHSSISFYYDASERFVSSTPQPTASDYYWTPGTLQPGSVQTITVTTEANGMNGSQINNEACATADNSPDVCAYNLINVGEGSAAPLAASIPKIKQGSSEKEAGLWVWDSPLQMSASYETQAVDTAEASGFNALYVTVDDYLPIAQLPAGAVKSQEESTYLVALHTFVSLAKARGIAVDIEGGARDWSESVNNWKGYALIDLLKEYNAAYPDAPVRGLQYDVESYLSPAYQANKAAVLEDFVNFIAASARRMAAENPGSRFTVVIPHFYDALSGWTPKIAFQGTMDYTFTDLLTALEAKPGSYLIVMAYRNFLDGTNGSIALAHAEVEEASAPSSTVKIIIAQETGNVEPGYVTFFGKTKSDLFTALAGINDAFSAYPAFGGIAVDYLDPYKALQP